MMTSDAQVRLFLIALAVDMLIPVIRIGRFTKPVLGTLSVVLFGAALFWPRLKPLSDPEFASSLHGVAVNAWVWLGLIGLAVVFSIVPSLPANSNPMSPLPIYKLPAEPLSLADKERLKKGLSHSYKDTIYNIQIIYGPGDRCARLAKDISEVISECTGWVQVSPPMQATSGATIPQRVEVHASSYAPASEAASRIHFELGRVGIDNRREDKPELRHLDHCCLYINEGHVGW